MKLLSSMLTTTVIVGLVWSVAYAHVSTTKETTATKTTPTTSLASISVEPHKPATRGQHSIQNLEIAGVSDRILLKHIDKLWQKFDNNMALHAKLVKQPKKVYVYYRSFGQDYLSADVSIGYADNILDDSGLLKTKLDGTYITQLEKGTHSTATLTAAWQKIDYRQPIKSVVEVYYLDNNSQPIASTMLIAYQ